MTNKRNGGGMVLVRGIRNPKCQRRRICMWQMNIHIWTGMWLLGLFMVVCIECRLSILYIPANTSIPAKHKVLLIHINRCYSIHLNNVYAPPYNVYILYASILSLNETSARLQWLIMLFTRSSEHFMGRSHFWRYMETHTHTRPTHPLKGQLE